MTRAARSQPPEEFVEDEPQMTPEQKRYLLDLVSTRRMPSAKRNEAFRQIEAGLSKKEASRWIDKALTLPKDNSEFAYRQDHMPKVPDGRYALLMTSRVAGEDVETLKFYKVKTPTDGRWAGFTFLDAGRGGAHGDLQWTPIKELPYKMTVLRKIAKDPEAAGMKFGQEVGVCCRCGRSLTDETSRALGIGPDCREKGW